MSYFGSKRDVNAWFMYVLINFGNKSMGFWFTSQLNIFLQRVPNEAKNEAKTRPEQGPNEARARPENSFGNPSAVATIYHQPGSKS